MPKTILLVGHCGPDSSYLRRAIKSAIADVRITSADDNEELAKEVGAADLVLVNRELGYGFDPPTGVEMIRQIKSQIPHAKLMLVSNYPEAQQAAAAAGAVPGFGKREIGSHRVTQLLQDAVALRAPAGQSA